MPSLAFRQRRTSLALQAALQDLSKREAALRAARESYTDEHKIVQDLRLSVQTMRTQTLPQVINTLIARAAGTRHGSQSPDGECIVRAQGHSATHD